MTGVYDQLWGNSSHDQPIFANSYWLATDTYSGTPWGAAYMPFTLNGWTGTSFYVQETSASLANSSQLLSRISSDVDTYYPLTENVRYYTNTYHPAGFNTSQDYAHWDTLYGYFWSGGEWHVNQGQVYGNPWTAAQEFSLGTIWSAVSAWYGIVW